jgi:hypothetical protein
MAAEIDAGVRAIALPSVGEEQIEDEQDEQAAEVEA